MLDKITIMTTINFTQKGDLWVSEDITVKNDYNIHLEREGGGMVQLGQKTAGNLFASVVLPQVSGLYSGTTVDIDISHGVYPKTIKITSYSKVLTGIITEKIDL